MGKQILDEIRAMHLLGSAVDSAVSIDTVLQSAADSVARLLPCDRVSLIELNTETQTVGFFAKGGKGSAAVDTTVGFEELNEGLSGWAIQHRKPALSVKGVPDPRESATVRQRRLETNCGSIIVVPLQVAGNVLGTMSAINLPEERDFVLDDVEIMELFADYCAIIIQNTRHFIGIRTLSQGIAELNQTLKSSNQLKDSLFMILAHDLRGSVGGLAVLLDAVLANFSLHGELREALQLGQDSAQKTVGLLENLLNWAQNQVRGDAVPRVPVLVCDCVEGAVSWSRPQYANKGVRIYVEAPRHLSLTTDQSAVETILRNLLSNALKYSLPSSQVLVRASQNDSTIVIEIEDFGQGMDPGTLERLFSSRTKVKSQPGTSGERGNGLGLMFCADLAESLGGTITGRSQLGSGSVFRLSLPVAGSNRGIAPPLSADWQSRTG
jgi:signal transduction histidine kinase